MKRIRRRLERNSRKNPWRNTWQDKSRRKVDALRVLGSVLVLSLPLFLSSLVFAVLVNTPDVYEYNMKGTQAVEQGRRYVSQEDVLALIDDFMAGKTDDFVLLEDTDYKPENVFSEEDQQAMEGFRRWANDCITLALVTGFFSLVIYVLLLRSRRKDVLRLMVPLSAVPLALIQVLQFLAKTVKPVMKLAYGRFYSGGFPEGDFLVRIARESFGRQLATFELLGCLALYLVLLYVTYRLAGRTRLFRGGGEVEYLRVEHN